MTEQEPEYNDTMDHLNDPDWDAAGIVRDARNEVECGGYYEAAAVIDFLWERCEAKLDVSC